MLSRRSNVREKAGAVQSKVTAQALSPSHEKLAEPPRNLQVLVAEDNAVNIALLVRLLQKMGHTPVVVHNGTEAVSLAGSRKFDVAFMDVQMPEMDGFTATTAIREQETRDGGHLPIIAMTAHAMKGDRERCLAAGMDGYIAKPARFSDIERMLMKLMTPSSPSAPPVEKLPWDRSRALERLGGDEDLLGSLCQIFLEESPKLFTRLQQAVAEGDCEAAMRAAHSLKGEISCFTVDGAFHAAGRLEKMAGEKDLTTAADALATLKQEMERLQVALKDRVGANS